MGYRSDVTIVIYGEKDDVTAFIASERLKGTPKGMSYHPFKEPISDYHERDMYDYDCDNDNGKSLSRSIKYTMLVFRWSGVKWYDSYPEIDYWVSLASVWEDAFKNTLCMEVARCGEQSDDVECDYYGESPQYHLSIYTEVSEDNMPSKSESILAENTNLKGEQNE